MLKNMTENEINRIIKATSTCTYLQSATVNNLFFARVLQAMPPLDGLCTAKYMFNLGQVISRLEGSMDEDCKHLPNIDETPIIEFIQRSAGNSPQSIVEGLYQYLTCIQDEAYRYGYYAALENENIIL